MRSIRKKITVCLMATVLIALFAVGGVSIALNYRSTVATVDQMMSETAVLATMQCKADLYMHVVSKESFITCPFTSLL